MAELEKLTGQGAEEERQRRADEYFRKEKMKKVARAQAKARQRAGERVECERRQAEFEQRNRIGREEDERVREMMGERGEREFMGDEEAREDREKSPVRETIEEGGVMEDGEAKEAKIVKRAKTRRGKKAIVKVARATAKKAKAMANMAKAMARKEKKTKAKGARARAREDR